MDGLINSTRKYDQMDFGLDRFSSSIEANQRQAFDTDDDGYEATKLKFNTTTTITMLRSKEILLFS